MEFSVTLTSVIDHTTVNKSLYYYSHHGYICPTLAITLRIHITCYSYLLLSWALPSLASVVAVGAAAVVVAVVVVVGVGAVAAAAAAAVVVVAVVAVVAVAVAVAVVVAAAAAVAVAAAAGYTF